jgi:hypothetical protein
MGIMTSSSKGATRSMQEGNLRRRLPFILFVLALVIPIHCIAGELHSGIYENLVLAVDPAGDVIGRYEESQGEGVSKNCSFFLKGKARSGEANLITWSDRVLPGVLRAVKDGVELKVPSGGDHAGCGLVLLPQMSEGIPLDLVRRTKWLDVRVVAAEQAVLHPKPADSRQTVGFFPRGTMVGVLTKKDGWLLVESTQLEHKKVGWIKEGEAKEPTPPRLK